MEYPFRVIKRQFGHMKVRYRGLTKNTVQLHTLFAPSNLWMVRHRLLQGLQACVQPQAAKEPPTIAKCPCLRSEKYQSRHDVQFSASEPVANRVLNTFPRPYAPKRATMRWYSHT